MGATNTVVIICVPWPHGTSLREVKIKFHEEIEVYAVAVAVILFFYCCMVSLSSSSLSLLSPRHHRPPLHYKRARVRPKIEHIALVNN